MDWEKHFAQIGRIAFSFSVLEEIVSMSIRGAFWLQEDLAVMSIERMRFTPQVELLRKICEARLPKEDVAGVGEQLKELIRLAERRNDVIHSVIYPIPENEDVAALRQVSRASVRRSSTLKCCALSTLPLKPPATPWSI